MLRAEKISKEFIREMRGTNRFTAVSETDFNISGGELAVITGRSGSGKSTFLNMLAGLLTPTGGKVFFEDTDIYSLSDRELSRLRNQKTGFIPQGQTAIHSLNVIENILLPCSLYGEYNEADVKYAYELMERLDILNLENVFPKELSGGEIRRMSIARALIKKPVIILADEPTGDLDDGNTRTVFEFFRDISKNGSAVIIVTHETDSEKYADRVLRMNGGVLSENKE
ncbi:MAG: ABC transporter ATP-binding protein [Ruminococcus sp.]|nr:ABC transporter ATP-binding protein [Ruminococcus sp.]